MRHSVRISRSTVFFDSKKQTGISNAIVSISCEGRVYNLTESSTERGVYLTAPDFYGISGKTYTFNAILDFNENGKIEKYEAQSYLPFPITLDSVAVIPSIMRDNFLQVVIWGNLSKEDKNNLGVHLLWNDTMLYDTLDEFRIIDCSLLVDKRITSLLVFHVNQDRPNLKFSYGDKITVEARSLTAEYAVFLTNAKQELGGSIPFFGGPPANIETNIRSLAPYSDVKISGFFTAFSKHKVSIIYK